MLPGDGEQLGAGGRAGEGAEAPERSGGVAPTGAPALGLVPDETSRRGGVELALFNRETGELVKVDPARRRLANLRRRVHAFGEMASDWLQDGRGALIFLTLTYAPGRGYRPGDVERVMRWVRGQLGDGLVAYARVAEVQQKRMEKYGESVEACAHHHLLLLVRRGSWLPKPDQAGGWSWGMTKVQRNIRSAGYLQKYVQKGGGLPRGMRAYDVRIRAAAGPATWARARLALARLPYWLERIATAEVLGNGASLPIRGPKGWLHAGRVYRSPWILVRGGRVEW